MSIKLYGVQISEYQLTEVPINDFSRRAVNNGEDLEHLSGKNSV